MNAFTIIICFVLFVTNPTTTDFTLFLDTKISQKLDGGNGDEMTKLAKFFLSGITSETLASATYRKDYYLFSTYTVDSRILNYFNQNIPKKIEFIGIGHNFYPLP